MRSSRIRMANPQDDACGVQMRSSRLWKTKPQDDACGVVLGSSEFQKTSQCLFVSTLLFYSVHDSLFTAH
ncbi:hypothetical protein RT761_00496 [Atribacter laminatus]|uniref:Uncharacterized protein n=1 Tax=Atribacter laminatus TaxID=2847778 RepID=A0A7T1AJX8_ATRLM|nr:hypothetical protein RT761_00496 [Atribacter laminatus]